MGTAMTLQLTGVCMDTTQSERGAIEMAEMNSRKADMVDRIEEWCEKQKEPDWDMLSAITADTVESFLLELNKRRRIDPVIGDKINEIADALQSECMHRGIIEPLITEDEYWVDWYDKMHTLLALYVMEHDDEFMYDEGKKWYTIRRKQFTFTIKQMVSRDVHVEAETEEQALQKMKDMIGWDDWHYSFSGDLTIENLPEAFHAGELDYEPMTIAKKGE